MRNIVILASLILACATSAASQVTNAYEVNGPIKTARLEVAKITTMNGQSVEGPRTVVELLTFDRKGKFTDQTVKNPDGSIKRKHAWKSSYDESGRLTRREFYDAKGVQTCFATYAHDDKARVSKATFFCPGKTINHHESFFYDDDGHKVREEHTNADGTLRNTIVNVYDNGRVVQENYYRPDGSLRQRNILVYDPQGNRTEIGAYDDKGSILFKFGMSYTAASKGKPAELLRYSKLNTLLSKETYTYEFDSHDNWTKRKTVRELFDADAPRFEVEVEYRTLKYYESAEVPGG